MFADTPRRQRQPPFGRGSRRLNLMAYAAHPRALNSFRKYLGYWPNIAFPVTYHEKMFWRRVFDHDPFHQACCDKLAGKAMFAALADPVPSPETLWTGDRPEDYPAELMRDDVVVKMTAGCRMNWFFAEQGRNRRDFERTCRHWLARPYGGKQSQWGYRDLPRRLMAERVVAGSARDIEELKVHCLDGKVNHVTVYRGEKTDHSGSAIFSAEGLRADVFNTVAMHDPARRLPQDYRLPACFGRAVDAARIISRGHDYLRVDFMVAGGMLWAGEVTAYPSAGLMGASDARLIRSLANNWDMRLSWFVRTPQEGWLEAYRQQLLPFVETNGPPARS